jgi:magnesium transporter
MEVLTAVERDRIAALRARDEFFWLDLKDLSHAELEEAGQLLGLHELAMEDTLEMDQRPKLDRYADSVLLVYWTARDANGGGMKLAEIHLHISGGFLFTARHGACMAVDELHATLAREAVSAEEYIVYRVLDVVTDALYPVIDQLEERIDRLEGEVLNETTSRQLGEIHRLKQDVHLLQRRLVPQRDQFPAVIEAIGALPGLTRGPREYLGDVADHLVQVTSELHRQSEDLASLTSTYFNANQNRLNRLATRLTVIATFFLFWSLVTSFFGQNFRWLVDHIDSMGAFVFYETVALVLPTIALGVYFWRRRREWL